MHFQKPIRVRSAVTRNVRNFRSSGNDNINKTLEVDQGSVTSGGFKVFYDQARLKEMQKQKAVNKID